MGAVQKSVFISYRRDSAGAWAHAIYEHLTRHGFDVFLDVNTLRSGDFETVILGNVRGRAHFVVLLTPSAMERLKDSDDWLRREIETAIRSRRNIVPLMLEGFTFSNPAINARLTGNLEPLKRYNALSVSHEQFQEAMARLRTWLEVPLERVPHPLPHAAHAAAKEQQAAASEWRPISMSELAAEQLFELAFFTTDLKQRIRIYTEVIKLKPDYAEAYNNRSASRRTDGDPNGAARDAAKAVKLKPDLVLGHVNLGIARAMTGDYPGALSCFGEAIRLDPNSPSAFLSRGKTRSMNGDFEGALEDYDRAIRLNPTDSMAFDNRGFLNLLKRRLHAAIDDFTEAIRLNPSNSQAYNNRGTAFSQLEDWDRALADFNQAIACNPTYALAYSNRSRAHKQKGDRARAASDRETAEKLGYIARNQE